MCVFSAVFDQILFILAGNDMYKSLNEFKVSQIQLRTTELAVFECQKKIYIDIMRKRVPRFLCCFLLDLFHTGTCRLRGLLFCFVWVFEALHPSQQITRTYIKAWILNLSQIPLLTMELAALERLKNIPYTYNGEVMSPC